MTEEVLFYPIVFKRNHEKLFCVNVVIIDPFGVEANILSVDNFKAACRVIISPTPKSSLNESKFFFFGVIHYFLNEQITKSAISSQTYNEETER
jgi:hypothetical protein